jgi:hypothetical protein
MTKKDFELIAGVIEREARATLAVYRMHKASYDNQERADLAKELDTLWGLTLGMRNSLQRYHKFDEHKFIEACGTSPQNWRFMNWQNGKYVNTYKSLSVTKINK